MPNWKKVIVSGSEASLSNLFVDNSITASIFSGSAFTGSFKGDGSELRNVPFDDGLPDNNWDFNIPDETPINDFQTASNDYLIDFRNQVLVGDPAGLIAWFGNSDGNTQLLPTNNGLIIIADDEQQGLVTSQGYSGSIVGIGNVMNFSSSVDSRLNNQRTDFNSFTSSYTIVSSSLDTRLDVLEAYSASQQVPTSSYSLRTTQTDVYCKNMSGYQINKGNVVRIVNALGDNPLIETASYLSEGNSANTLGIATENIPNDSFGMIITEGVLVGVNTTGMTAGNLIYLGDTGSFITTTPIAPNHGVRLGQVLRANQNNGSIHVRIDNGMELDEAHDVTYNSITTGDLLVRSGSVWKNSKQLSGSYQITGSLSLSGSDSVLVLPNHSTAPSSPVSGTLYFNTTDFHFYGWNGAQWKQLDN